ncbi:hypothetical protein N7462_007757 [Penicillium macrosclerotiorum]|uniref:uncharacterized protein n=1 Tax=Penicillium macrosclerotiorum TaxID=303699 RepID=UPI0025492A48|nr:uncharacterized protein N7462_007757 [Penicillium macrosclerotiorum]KAJ5679513.1 hypothetical protein N7462_007757 [Penicillium macrosclerotiorum]
MPSQEQIRRDLMMKARQQQMVMRARQQREAAAASQSAQSCSMAMGSHYDDIPILEAEDLDHILPEPPSFLTFDSVCQRGVVSAIEEIVSSQSRTPAFLHRGLLIALRVGNVDAARYLLENGAPIVRQTPEIILKAPLHQRIALFELLAAHGWTPNTPGYYGAVLLPRVLGNLPLLSWFLEHGANPNLGTQKDFRDRHGSSDTESCNALEFAAAHHSFESVQMLLNAGARIQNGAPLHFAAGVCPPGANPHTGRVEPSKEFDTDRIPVMRLLVEYGADVNYKIETRHMKPQYALVYAVMAGAMERVKWLLKEGADPFVKGRFPSAVSYASFWGEEMERVIQEGIAERHEAAIQALRT